MGVEESAHYETVPKQNMERMGVSAIIVWINWLKKNSLFGTDVEQNQGDIGHFAKKQE